jgi:hypothetical protein
MVYALIVIFTLLYHLNNLDISILLTMIGISKPNDIRDIQNTVPTEYSIVFRRAQI